VDYPSSSSNSYPSENEEEERILPVQYGSGVCHDNDDDWETESLATESDVPELPPLEILDEHLCESRSRNSRTLELTLRFTAPDPNGDDVLPIRTIETAIKEIFR